jgi:LPS export ABC transporter permease LptG
LRGRRRARRDRRRRRRRAVPAHVVLRLPRPRLRFPNLLDRYVLLLFARVFLMVTLSGVAIYVIADLTEIFRDVLRTRVPLRVIADYYKFLSLQIFFDVSPVMVLITTLVTYSLLSRSNEVTACKALGVSLYRLCLPALAGAMLVALFAAFLQVEVLPASNQRVAQLKDRIKGREAARTYRRADRQWLFGQGRYIYNYQHYDPRSRSLQRLQIFEFDEGWRLVRRVFAAEARYRGPGWVFTGSWVRTFDGGRIASYERLDRPVVVLDYRETPEYFESEVKRPEQMSYTELRDYIRELRSSGEAVPELEVEFYSKIALPIVSFVMSLVALPFAFRLGRRGALYSVGLAVVLGMVFLGVFAFFQTMGETATFPAAVAVWSPSLLFALLSGYLFLGVRT